ncbi:uroporphyrinogen-III C-methyltransferase [Xanthovirga aplysinae]|uniref:uroporphyrinogen-III C-methyltransferase n=1 Tax=Xanthovirga aplysinae TaxID=2529853 RepID=UPI0012BD1056|nr:uroporphyrinogen-III C-methyltransferase [Xanthovirga aplysinae]MTI31363.1 uroporphyrinogen-III C-methyltransferase [Xanthovirga aplysinae]
MQPQVTLVGAGPGDPDLISLKGVKALKNADVVLYDALVNPLLLNHCSPSVKKVYVGKRAGKASYTQEEINQLMVSHALSHGHVVRLKGGDPFIFGRGKEELEYVQFFNIPTEVVLGISSVNLPGYYGIPLTKRGINQSFWVVTATNKEGNLTDDVRLAAQSSATVVLLMGLKKLEEIVTLFKENEKGDLPIAIISKGSTVEGKVIFGTIDTIVEKKRKVGVTSPAMIIIGEVVASHEQFNEWREETAAYFPA